MEFIICHAEITIAFVEETKIPEVITVLFVFGFGFLNKAVMNMLN